MILLRDSPLLTGSARINTDTCNIRLCHLQCLFLQFADLEVARLFREEVKEKFTGLGNLCRILQVVITKTLLTES